MSDLYVGVDLGGTTIKAAVANPCGQILARSTVKTLSHEGPNAVINRIRDLIEKLASKVRGEDHVFAAMGIGVPGLVDLERGITKFLPNLPSQWRNVPVADLLRERLHCPVQVLNDVRTATLGELRFGHGRSLDSPTLVFFSIGTGVGGGIAIDGRLRLGPLGAAGELGHQTIVPDGPLCGCGNRGCLEALASGPAIAAEGVRLMRSGLAPKLHELTGGDANQVTTYEMGIAAEHDRPVRKAIQKAATYIGIAAANTVTILHPDLIVLGGGVSKIGKPLLKTVRQVVIERVGMFPTDKIGVQLSRLGEDAGLMGAIALAVDR